MKPLVVAGNGPSLKNIDYELLPADFDLFRANQFYAEDRYYLGKKVTGAFFNLEFLRPQTYTFYQLKERGEYEIEHIYCSYAFPLENHINPQALSLYPEIRLFHDYIQQIPELYTLNCCHERYTQRHFTTGICMLITGIVLGYREFYMTGIDFYEGRQKYAFEHSENMRKLLPQIDDSNHKDEAHNKDIELHALKLCQSIVEARGGAIYSLSPKSPLSAIFSKSAPKRTHPTDFREQFKRSKPANSIRDILLTVLPRLKFQPVPDHSAHYLASMFPVPYARQVVAMILRPLLRFVLRRYFRFIKKIYNCIYIYIMSY